ncbi:Ldh family oxidoreductase [Uliginosibacterium paludis]|uniref:Ldh family oxidoreductase n=1 Tax=Uliginosibacterium paludis TaxID=1615952 RepID=UPI003609143F
MPSSLRIPYPALCDLLAAALTKAGLSAACAATEARIMAEADLLGVPSHGIRMLPPLLTAMAEGRVNPSAHWQIERETLATSLLDCENGPGRASACHAMDDAVSRARHCGIGACLARRTTHWGRAHAYAARAAQQGMIGLCMTNAMPTMAAWGATRRIIGNNPIAIGIPQANPDTPLVLDIAMSQAAVGKVNTWKREERDVPPGWGLDAEGRPSQDAAAILAGAVLPFGGHKGAGLALMVELLTAALAGGAFGNEIVGSDRSGLDPDSCKLFIAIDPAAFGGRETLNARVESMLAYLATEAAPFVWPGQRGWAERDANLVAGVPVHLDIVRELAAAGVSLEAAG